MTLRQLRKRLLYQRKNAEKRFEKHRRANLLATPGMHDYVIILDHLKSGFNVGKIFRSADAFGASEVHLIGIDFFDPAPAMGSFKWVPARFHKTFDACYEELREQGYTLFTAEPATGTDLPRIPLPQKSGFILGHEEFGISFDKDDYDGIQTLKIPQFGKVQSLNVSIAASVIMYEYIRQHHLL